MAAASTSIFSTTLDHFLKDDKKQQKNTEEDEFYLRLKLRKELKESGQEEIGRCECCGRRTKNLHARKMYDPKSGQWVIATVGPECSRHKPILGECRREAARARWYKKRKLKAMPRIAGLSLAEVKA